MALITLTPGQFAKTPVGRKPGASYKNYLSYVNRRRQAKQPALPMGVSQINRLLTQYLGAGFQSPAVQRRQAIQSVNDAIAQSLGDLRSTTKAEQEQANRQAAAYEGFSKALMGMRAGDAGLIHDLYSGAASDQARFAQGVTGAVGAAASSDAAAQQADVAAATGGMPGYHGTDVGALGMVGNYIGGYLPSASLAENAAYEGVNQLNQGFAGSLRLGLESGAIRQKTLDLQKELAQERAKLARQRPSLVRQALSDVQSGQRSDLATLANVLYLQNTQAKTTADLTGQYQGQDTINTYRDANGVLRNYNPNTHIVKTSRNGTQFLAPLPVPKGSSSSTPRDPKTGLTPSQTATQNRMRQEALQQGRSNMLKALQNKKGPLWNQPDPLLGSLGKATPRSYAAAKKYLMTNYANDLIKQYKGEKQRILAMVEEVLASAGFKRGSGAAASSRQPQTGAPLFPILNPGFPLPSR